ncbi:MAG: WD40 repeat domain-containing protein [Cytophagales bacterium]|nr:MAG: WD40 repeat domain-containing protein [Cytophagales bacterium]
MRNFLKISSLVIVSLLMQLCTERQIQKQEVADNEVFTLQSGIKQTFASTDVPFQTIAVENERNSTVKLANGTEIQVPEGAFVDKNGNPINGKVLLSYREFHNGADIIASGIPMTYKSENNSGAFESGGMFEIRGTHKGQKVYLREGKQLKVNLASFTDETNFNHYFLAENEVRTAYQNSFFTPAYAQSNSQRPAQWMELGQTQTVPNYRKNNELDSLEAIYTANADMLYQTQNEENNAAASSPELWTGQLRKQEEAIAKLSKKEQLNYFHLNFNLKENPDLAIYAGIKWHYEGIDVKNENPNLTRNKWALHENWEQISFVNPVFMPKKEVKAKRGASKVKKIVFAPDSKHFLVINEIGADLWTQEGKFVHHFKQVNDAVFAPDNQHLLVAVRNEAKIMNFSGKKISQFKGHSEAIQSVEFSTKGDYVLTFSADETAKLWDSKGDNLLTLKDSPKSWLVGAKFYNPEGSEVIVKTHDGETMRYGIKGNFIDKLAEYERNAEYSSYFPKPNYLFKNTLVVSQNKPVEFVKRNEILCTGAPLKLPAVAVYNLKSKTAIDELVLQGKQVANTYLSPDNQYVVTSVKDNGSVVVWNKNNDENIVRLKLSKTETVETPSGGENIFSYSFSTLVSQKELGATTQSPSTKPSITALNMRYQMAKKAYIEAKIAKDKERLQDEADLLRVFSVNQFGVYNCDRIYNAENVISFNANFDFGQNTHLRQSPKLFLITGNRGTAVIESYASKNTAFYFNPKDENRMIIVLPDDKVAVFQKEDFKKIDLEKLKTDKSYTFDMRVMEASVKSMDDLKKIFN